MNFRHRRQLAVVIVVAVVLFGISFWIYAVNAPKPNCQDNKLNQEEEEADCGGPCIPCAFRHQKPLEVFWVRFVKVRENAYDVAAEVRNPNVKLGANSLDYEFQLFDTAGVLVASRRNTSFIYPGETMHLVEVGLVSGRVIRNTNIVIENERWVLSNVIAPDVVTGNREYNIEDDNGNRRSVVQAIANNRTVEDIPNVLVSVLVLNQEGNLLGVHRTVLDEIGAGQSQPMKFVWPEAFAEPISSMIIEARSAIALPHAGP